MQTSSLARPAPSEVTKIPPGGSELESRVLREATTQFLPRKPAKKQMIKYIHSLLYPWRNTGEISLK